MSQPLPTHEDVANALLQARLTSDSSPVIVDLAQRIVALCEAPHWTNERRHTIANFARAIISQSSLL